MNRFKSTPVKCQTLIINPTTPAQYFHALRRQLKRPFRKPLIVVGPKTLLKLGACQSDMADMAPGTSFEPVLAELVTPTTKRVLFISGKMYYDLAKERSDRKLDNQVAIVRLEELCPFPANELASFIGSWPSSIQQFIWCQEEPQNMGAYTFVAPRLAQLLPSGVELKYIGREASAAPATGIGLHHKQEVSWIMNECFKGL
jgi:probable 2-oxoglutarate dehydrogenase E1 component DHKTD1